MEAVMVVVMAARHQFVDMDAYGYGGGGSTDFRFSKGNDRSSLLSRIIVAAGGGGTPTMSWCYGGNAGNPYSSKTKIETHVCSGASSPGVSDSGTYLYGQNGYSGNFANCQCEGNGGGCGGYFGGKAAQTSFNAGGSGGTAFVSPKLKSPVTLGGENSFLSPFGQRVTGWNGDGHARIKYLGGGFTPNSSRPILKLLCSIFTLIL